MYNRDYLSTFCSPQTLFILTVGLFTENLTCQMFVAFSCYRFFHGSLPLNLSGATVKLCLVNRIMDSFWTLYLPIDCYGNIPSLSRLFCGYLRNACQALSVTLVQKMGKSYGKGFSNERRCRIIILTAEELNNAL